MEKYIERCEKKIAQLNDAVMAATQAQDGQSIADISKDIHKHQTMLETHFSEFESLYEEKEHVESEYQGYLNDFE